MFRRNKNLHLLSCSSCASYVGFIGGEQPVFIGPPCIVGNIVHEILHALGFHHEHTRTDREQYIKILPQNIMAGNVSMLVSNLGQRSSLDVLKLKHSAVIVSDVVFSKK